MKKRILVIARNNLVEALRVAAGLTLADDTVQVASLAPHDDSPAVREQLEVLNFADVPVTEYADPGEVSEELALALIDADVVYVL